MKGLTEFSIKLALVLALLLLYGTLLFSTIFAVVSVAEILGEGDKNKNALMLSVSLIVLASAIFGIKKLRESRIFQSTQQGELVSIFFLICNIIMVIFSETRRASLGILLAVLSIAIIAVSRTAKWKGKHKAAAIVIAVTLLMGGGIYSVYRTYAKSLNLGDSKTYRHVLSNGAEYTLLLPDKFELASSEKSGAQYVYRLMKDDESTIAVAFIGCSQVGEHTDEIVQDMFENGNELEVELGQEGWAALSNWLLVTGEVTTGAPYAFENGYYKDKGMYYPTFYGRSREGDLFRGSAAILSEKPYVCTVAWLADKDRLYPQHKSQMKESIESFRIVTR